MFSSAAISEESFHSLYTVYKRYSCILLFLALTILLCVCLVSEGAAAELPPSFSIELNADPFYSEENMQRLRNAMADARAGRNMTEHELIKED